jgi:MFS family permease
MGSAMNIALPMIGRDYNLSAVALNWIVTSYILTAAVCLVPGGRLADMYGRLKIFRLGIFLFTIFSFAAAFAPNVGLLIAFRVLQAMGASLIFGTGMAILISVYPPQERGKVLGINIAAVYTGLSAGPFLGGILCQAWGWHSIFVACGLLGAFALAGAVWKLRGESAHARGERFDLAGAVVYGLGLVTLMYGFSRLPRLPGLGFVAAGLVLLVVFIRWERRVEHPS